MATLKTTFFKKKIRKDGTWLVYVLLIHEGKKRYIPTSVYIERKDLTASFKIKNNQVIEKLEGLVYEYRKRLNSLDVELTDMDIEQIARLITRRTGGAISLTDYFEGIWVKENAAKKGLKNYVTAMNAFKLFLTRNTIMASDVTTRGMKAFESSLKDRPRAMSLYCSAIARIFNDARAYYNDEDNGLLVIKHSIKSYHAPRPNVARKRALPVEAIRRIFQLPYEGKRPNGRKSRRDLALDCFKLSFCLMGMNSADLFNATAFDGEYITYNRTKTKDRRSDRAFMKVKVYPVIKPIVEKYRGKEHVFNFCERFSTMADLNRSINKGLKEIGAEIGVDGLQFYAARHSMASIAVNKAGVSKYVMNDMLCHTIPSLRVTELYIEKDFNPINEANGKLLDYVFNDSPAT